MVDKKKIEKGIKLVMEALGADLKKKDLADTPKRVADMYEEILAGQFKDAAKDLEVILEQTHDEIILVKDIPVYSICEHHLLPFVGKAHVAYIPNKQITGLSKIARVVDISAKKLQVQERLTTDVADIIMKKLKPKGAMVVIEAEHLCMTMRGAKKPGTKTVTSVVRGIFRKNQKTRQEALSLIS
ncbi:MAG: GTP cyclohydrolase I FolE [Candidatus Omnitrophica bacterium]|nr:GTP cyclohydrolase I FolE [Candidatus Omnitrophota bacterium]MCF7891637.1 GTP cyclohydrolase I FolE [Candidatus Omnitrophota bacterium]MCF7895909.1 GTP cyclohydrolase I FolE [Candidatus Omnitrophota bacterium]MCF7897258.1 GTP cyclohydrolase I FolE [Candidatus Omnitrophota bacterium]MCF7909293.1 GTP cyclohydrolase I FolE [Candidatus Omnitrophota bacterium]